jgi:hypothetical protein
VTGDRPPTPLSRRLGIRERSRVAVLGAPTRFADLLEPLPAGARIVDMPRKGRCYDVVVVFVHGRNRLVHAFERGRPLMCEDGGLWVCWPKSTSNLAQDVGGGHVRDQGLDAGLVDNKICSIDENWSALRFVVRRGDRSSDQGGAKGCRGGG